MSAPKPCLGCGIPTRKGSRCALCERALNRLRNAKPERAVYRDPAYRAMARTGTCHLCGEPGADTLDHIIPISRGGTNHPDNLKPAHRACNSAKGNRDE